MSQQPPHNPSAPGGHTSPGEVEMEADHPPVLTGEPMALPLRLLLLALSVLSLATGIVGIFVPGLPTTVFVLIAGWAAARSSPRLHGWLWRHRIFGPMLQNWAEGGYMSRRAKWSATAMMLVCALVLILSRAPAWAKITANACMGLVLIWLWLRPLPPTSKR